MLRIVLVRVAAILFSVLFFLATLATLEAALRIIYRDAGRRTLGGPGGRPFDHVTIGPEELRGRRDTGPKPAGVPRIMVMGDSITYGQGVHDWHDTWPERLSVALEAARQPHQMAVFAVPGQDIPQHLRELEHWGRIVNPESNPLALTNNVALVGLRSTPCSLRREFSLPVPRSPAPRSPRPPPPITRSPRFTT